MCSGKTTLGRALSCRLGIPFTDLDEYIEERRGCSVSDIFARVGEAGFRAIETEALREICRRGEVAIIACGGGTPCFGDNLDIMRRAGVTVWLDADLDRLAERLAVGADQRPLARGKSLDELRDFIADTLAKRRPYYSRAELRLDASRLEDERQIAESVDSFITLLNQHAGLSTPQPQ